MIATRKSYSFVTCFCEDSQSPYHFSKYGHDRLGFDTFGVESIDAMRIPAFSSNILLFPVIYDEVQQRTIVRGLLSQLMKTMAPYIPGEYSFKTIDRAWIESSVARDVGQLFLDFLLGFKENRWKDDREWRLLCRPTLKLGSTAPKMADEVFDVAIRGTHGVKCNPRRVELRLPKRNTKCGLPLSKVCHSGSEDGVHVIREWLAKRWYDDVEVMVSHDDSLCVRVIAPVVHCLDKTGN